MSHALIIAETRKGVFEERNLDSLGLANLLQKESILLIPDGLTINDTLAHTILTAPVDESTFQNPLTIVTIIEKVIAAKGNPDLIIFTNSSSGIELASYTAGRFNLPLITDVSSWDNGIFSKSYYSDKIFGEFTPKAAPCVITVRSGSFKEHAGEKPSPASCDTIRDIVASPARTFIEYVEEEKGEVDITKADFLLSVGRGIGNKDEIPDYEELAGLLKATLSGSRPVIDKLWLPKPRQVGTSGKTVKPKVYLAFAISGAFQHIAGMKDAECIIAVNKDPEAPIFQYAHYGIVGDANKLRDKMRDIVKG
jgi:electron transfer flavoprotein alpha subunit